MEFIDTHAHLTDEKFAADLPEAIARARKNGVRAVVNFGDTLENSSKAVKLTQVYDGLYAGVGIHPEEAYPLTAADEERLSSWAALEKTVAIGEIGLDYYWEKDEERRQLQRDVFVRQLDLARQLHLPVCVHDREAHGDTLAILQREAKGVRGVLHCFSGSYEMALDIWRLGWYIGIDGPLTYKNAAKLPEIVAKAPADRLLIETDCPYLAPMPHRGKRNEPSFVRLIAEKLAEFRHAPLTEIAAQTTQNAVCLYGL